MADIDTNYHNFDTNKPWCGPIIIIFSPEEYVDLAVSIISAIALIIGMISWIIIKKFRCFKNYVFLNIILNNIVIKVLALLFNYFLNCTEVILYIFVFCFAYFKLTVNYWLLVMCYLFYKDLVKVFGGDVKRKYLRSNLFAWGTSFVFTICQNLALHFLSGKMFFLIYMIIYFFPLIINLLIYVRVLRSLLKAEVRNRSDWCRRLLVSTIIFFISGTLLLLMPFQELVDFPPLVWFVLMHVQAVSMAIYFFVVRLNRTIWGNHYTSLMNSRKNRKRQSTTLIEIGPTISSSQKVLLKRERDPPE